MKVTQQSHQQYRLQHIIFILLFLSIISSLAWLSTKYSTQGDWTSGQRNSLTADTIQLLNTLPDPILIRSYQSEDASIRNAVTEVLSRYQQHKKDLSFTILNPDLDIEQSKLDAVTLYGQTVISYNDRHEIINALNEQNIGNALLRLSKEHKAVLFFLQGHGERDPTNNSAIGYSNLSSQLQTAGFSLRALNLLRDTPSPDDGILIIAGAGDQILPGEIEQIRDYLQQGGNMLWLQDPGASENFKPVNDALGIDFIKGVVVDTDPQLRQVLRLSHPAKLPIISYKMHDITEKMQNFTLFVTAAAINARPASEWLLSPLLLTQKTSWSETQGFILDVEYNPSSGDTQGPLTIGLALERTLTERNNKQQRVVVIGDSDFLSNNNLGHGANIDFTFNVMNWLSKYEQLISISTKAAPDFKLELSDTEIAIIGFGFLLVLPGLLIIIGVYIWLKRRNQ